ncbi:hypothetical protein DQ04_03051020 [Trypanosoma grayi]|uniref:hypothetical protein n=1 Tax=Trypanosoma grayi TaxID=71804 RepID=UPI0004F4B5C7|nr:hypothetical protein DQ04_03051020 [Trypanosoma grayi]KEG11018.1 hypothetical protein DQ04_03051020 [Trypanosoma grayi]
MLHHAVRLRLLAQRLSAAGVMSAANCGMGMHALRQLDALNVRDRELLRRLDEVYLQTDIRSRANIFHCLACCVREQESVRESLSAALVLILSKMQESLLADVDDLSPTECILVMEGLVKVTPYRCVKPHLAAILRSRSTTLVDVVSSPVELIGIARIVVEAMQEAEPFREGESSSGDGAGGGVEHDDYRTRLGWSQELHVICQTMESRLDSFSKQDLLTLLDAVTLRVTPLTRTSMEGDGEWRQGRRYSSDDRGLRDVPDECRPLVLRVLSRVRQLATALSPSQVSAWLLRVVSLRMQHHPVFTSLLQRLDEEQVRSAMSLSQLSKSVESLGVALRWGREDDNMSRTDQEFAARVAVKLLETLVSALEQGDGSRNDCSAYLLPVLMSLSEDVATGKLAVPRPLMVRLFRIAYNHFDVLTPRERAEVVTTVFLWGVLKSPPGQRQPHRQSQCHEGVRNDAATSLAAWCDAIMTHADSYNALDTLQIINEVSAAVYTESATGNAYDASTVQPMLLQLHGRVQGMQSVLYDVPSSFLARYLSSMSKLNVRRKTDYYGVLNIIHKRELTNFEHLRVLGVVARHHLRAVPFLSSTLNHIPQMAASLHPKQKCLLLKNLGQARAQRFVRAPHHSSLALGTFLTRDEVVELPLLSAVFAFVGLVELRQFENETLDCLLRGPLSETTGYTEIRSATTLCELIAALSRVGRRRVPSPIPQVVLEVATNRLATSRSFFVDMAEISFWLLLVKEWPTLGGVALEEPTTGAYMDAVKKFESAAAAIATTRLLDIAGSRNLQLNTFLFNQMAIGYRLGVTLPENSQARLSQYLDTKHLPQLLSSPRQVVNAVTTALHICSFNPDAATEVFRFAVKNFGSLGVQEALVLGVDVAASRCRSDAIPPHCAGLLHKLEVLARQNVNNTHRRKKLSVEEIALGVRYGIAESVGLTSHQQG